MANPPTLAAGALRHRVILQRAVESRDDIGGVSHFWSSLASRWAKIDPLQGRELEAAQQIEARITHRVMIRPFSGLTAGDRVLFGSRIFAILAAWNVEEFGIITQLLCMEVS